MAESGGGERSDQTAVKRLRLQAGVSHDKLAAWLRERGHGGAIRQTIIRWEKPGAFPSRAYAESLADFAAEHGLDYTADDFLRPRNHHRPLTVSDEELIQSLVDARLSDVLKPLQEELRELRALHDGLAQQADPEPPNEQQQ